MTDAVPSPMLVAALAYARRGWPVFPCRDSDEIAVIKGEEVTLKCKAPLVPKGVKEATTDEAVIRRWWRRWPNAMIAVATGRNGMFVIDFDPRIDSDGVVFTLEDMKAELEAQMGCALPVSLAVITPSDGVHVYLAQPDDGGPAIRNRGVLPEHVDVRGQGGYVIVPPSVSQGGEHSGAAAGRYRWLRGDAEAPVADAPPSLIEILRAPKRGRGSPSTSTRSAAGERVPHPEEAVDDAIRRYGLRALDGECQAVATAASGQRQNALNAAAFNIAQLVAANAVGAGMARAALEDAARRNPGRDDDAQLIRTIDSGWSAGMQQPRDLAEIAAAARTRAERVRGSTSRIAAPHPFDVADGAPPSHQRGSGRDPSDQGGAGGDDATEDPDDITYECALLPLTDLGNAERFYRRHGRDFLYVPEWGWLARDGSRWNREQAAPLVQQAVYDTVRAIGDEADYVLGTGEREQVEGGLDFILPGTGEKVVWFSEKIAAWGRTSEAAGHLGCIARLAQPWLTAQPGDFDADPLRINVENGTLELRPPSDGFAAEARLQPFRRDDRMTKMARVRFDPKARAKRYDAFLERVQPDESMRRFLHVWGGYNLTGDTSAQKLVFNYGLGANGKSTWIDIVAFCAGDYATTVGIESFLDQGRGRKGGDATPDLAGLAGRRMVRTSEPEKGSKFADALVKLVTGGEPIKVRELNMPFFEMHVTFKLTVSGNYKPSVGTDHGIWRRMQLVPWSVTIPDAERDDRLVSKLKSEASGILNHLIAGALEWLTSGLPETTAIVEATREYQEESDPLGRFLSTCVRSKAGARVQSSLLHKVFTAWASWAGETGRDGKAWTNKGLTGAMLERGYRKIPSNTIQWLDIELIRQESDFIDADGHPVTELSPLPDARPGEAYDDNLP